jgi:hypothetical protein
MPRLASSEMFDLGFEQRGYVGARARTHRNASDRGATRVAPETEPEN